MPQVTTSTYNLGKSGRRLTSKNRMRHFNNNNVGSIYIPNYCQNLCNGVLVQIDCSCGLKYSGDVSSICANCQV